MLNLLIHSIFFWFLLQDFIGSLMRLLYPKPRFGPYAFLMNIFFALKGSKLFIVIVHRVDFLSVTSDLRVQCLRMGPGFNI